MIISKSYAEKLIRAGKADHIGYCLHDGDRYAVINRNDKQRTDHALMRENETMPPCKTRRLK